MKYTDFYHRRHSSSLGGKLPRSDHFLGERSKVLAVINTSAKRKAEEAIHSTPNVSMCLSADTANCAIVGTQKSRCSNRAELSTFLSLDFLQFFEKGHPGFFLNKYSLTLGPANSLLGSNFHITRIYNREHFIELLTRVVSCRRRKANDFSWYDVIFGQGHKNSCSRSELQNFSSWLRLAFQSVCLVSKAKRPFLCQVDLFCAVRMSGKVTT